MPSDQLPDPLIAVRGPRGPAGPREPWLRYNPEHLMTLPLAGQPGHGRTASLRRQPARISSGRMEGGYTDLFELICGQCGDHPYLDYAEIPSWLQRIRGPYTLAAGLAAYDSHIGSPQGPGASTARGRDVHRGHDGPGQPGGLYW